MRGFSSTGHYYVPVAGLPSTQAGVEALQNRVAGLMTTAEGQDYSFFIQQQIGRLEDLYNQCKGSETQLFKIFGVKDIEELNARFQIFLDQGLNALSAINLTPLFKDIRELINTVSTQQIIDLLNSNAIGAAIFSDPLTINKVQNTAGQLFGSLLSGLFAGTGKTGFQHQYTSKGSKTKVLRDVGGESVELLTIDNYLTIVENTLDRSPRIAKLQNLTPWMRKRILMAISQATGNPKLELTQQDIQQLFQLAGTDKVAAALEIDFRGKVVDLLRKSIPDPKLQQLFADEVMTNFQKYALSPNLSSVKGFAGELQFNLLLKAAFPMATPGGLQAIGNIIPTGNMIDMKGKQFGVDTVLQNAIGRFNFQVKNLSSVFNASKQLSRWEYKGQGSMSSILDRAGVNAQEDLSKFFASWGFNTTFESDPQRGWPGGYPSTFARFEEIAGKLDQIFLAYSDKLIRVDQLFQAQMDEFNLFPKGLYINTMFFVGQKLVPSSSILRGIINHFQKINTKEVIDFEISSVNKLAAQQGDTLYQVIRRYENTPNPPMYSVNTSNATDNIYMKYKVIINLENIMSSLL